MNKKTNNITNFLFEMASLRRIRRNHLQFIGNADDNISDHCFRVAIIGMILANIEKCDSTKVLKMGLFHDLEEARTGDANYVHKIYIERKKMKVRNDQFKDLPIEKEVLSILDEYYERKTIESKVAKDADNLDQMLLQQEYLYKDKTNLKIWHAHIRKHLITKTAKDIAKDIEETNPFEWLYSVAEKSNRENIER